MLLCISVSGNSIIENITIIDIITATIALMAFVLSLIVFCVDRKDRKNANAPLLIYEKEQFKEYYLKNGQECSFLNNEIPYVDCLKFQLDRRVFQTVRDGIRDKDKKTRVSLIMNFSEDNKEISSTLREIDYNRITLKNVGAPLISFQIKWIKIVFKEKEKLLYLGPNKGYDKLNIYIPNNNNIEISISAFYTESGKFKPFDSALKNETNSRDKGAYTADNMLETYMPVDASLFKDIQIYCITTNIYNKKYYQTMRMEEISQVIYPDAHLMDRKEKFKELVKLLNHNLKKYTETVKNSKEDKYTT